MQGFCKRLFIGKLILFGLFVASCSHMATTAVYDLKNVIAGKECVAIVPFDNLTSYPHAGRITSDLMAMAFYRSGKFRIMERTEIERIAALSQVTLPPRMDARFARTLGEVLGVDAVLMGSVSEYAYLDPTTGNPGVNLNVNLLDVETGKSLWVATHSRTSRDHINYKKDPVNRIAMLTVDHMTHPLFRKVPKRTVNYSEVCGNSLAIIPPPIPVEAKNETRSDLGVIAGRTLLKNGRVLTSVVLEFPNRNLPRILSDPESGSFKVDNLNPGKIRIIAKKDGFGEVIYEAEVKPGKITMMDLALGKEVRVRKRKLGTLTGKVLNVKGDVVDASVFLKSKNKNVDLRSSTGKDGVFSMKVAPGDYRVRFIAKGYISQSKSVKVEEKSKVILNVNLHPER